VRVWTDKYSILTGVVATSSVGFLSLSDDSVEATNLPFSQLVAWQQGKWGNNGQVSFSVISVSICTHPSRQMVAIGSAGEAYFAGNGDLHLERIGTAEETPATRGPLRSVRGISGKAYAVGMQRQVYRRDDRDLWICLDRGIRPNPEQVVGFESVDGFGADDIYAVGWEGEIWRFDGRGWHQVDSPTNFILTDVCCAGDGLVYACGRLGLLLVGRNDTWSVVPQESTIEDIWSLAWFRGFLYLATYRGLFRLSGGILEPVDMGKELPRTYYRVSANQDILWSIGAKDVMAFDGNAWTRIE
jgi:hypothetical protein